MPLQTVVCGALLIHFWPQYYLNWPRKLGLTIGIGVLALVIWIAPQLWFRFAPRVEGFNPEFFGATGWPYALNVGMRFVRLVVVVPLLEEIFWRGFLLRYLINENFTTVPFGQFSWLSFALVTAGFCFEHSFADWPAAILTGVLYNVLAYRSRSLSACVLTHAITNALLGGYVLCTRQWGFW
jgi:CAAX prenyl protease-like protein